MKTLFIGVLLLHLEITDSFIFSRRRRAPQPGPKDCVLSEWQTAVECSKDCGPSGVEVQRRTIVVEGTNGGKPCSEYDLERTVECNRVCYNEGVMNTAESRCDCPTGYTGECCGQDSKEYNEFTSNSGFATLLDFPLSSFINCQVFLLFLILFFRILLH